jgi:hypothetical protein
MRSRARHGATVPNPLGESEVHQLQALGYVDAGDADEE